MTACCCVSLPRPARSAEPSPLPRSAHNLLVEARITSNLDSYRKGRRGAPDHPVYDLRRRRFVKESQWHEYGVGSGQDLGVVPEDRPAWWMAEWPGPVEANYIALSGVYPNQPQPETCWKIEVRVEARWRTLARGMGGWYDSGRYRWGGAGTEPMTFDAFRLSVFSKDDRTPLKSIHFRGEEGASWVIACLLPIDAEIALPRRTPRAGRPTTFVGRPIAGEVKTWKWDFGDGQATHGKRARGKRVSHTFSKPGTYHVTLTFSDGRHTARIARRVTVESPVEARITPLEAPVFAGRAVEFSGEASTGAVKSWKWDFGDGRTGGGTFDKLSAAVLSTSKGGGKRPRHVYSEPGIYKVTLTVSDGTYEDSLFTICRAHTPATVHLPQVVLDTDQKNEQDDQYYFGYALFSELDLLGVNSVHHGGGQEPINYREILKVLDLARRSGLPGHREPFVFRGANERLEVPLRTGTAGETGGQWEDTSSVVTAASVAILAAARGASRSNPVWVVPVGPGTNVASAILQALSRNPDLAWLKARLRVMWLGGSNHAVTGEFNGNNDPWSMYVIARSGIETWIMPAPVGARVRIDKRKEGHLYAANPLGQYLRKITPARNKPLFDPSCLSAIISLRLGLGWIRETEAVSVAGPEDGYRWSKTTAPTAVRVIRQIDQEAMKADIFDTMKGKPSPLIGVPRRPDNVADTGNRRGHPGRRASNRRWTQMHADTATLFLRRGVIGVHRRESAVDAVRRARRSRRYPPRVGR